MRIKGTAVLGQLISRDNRFRVTVAVEGARVWAHLANSGRLGELLVPDCTCLLVERLAVGRKTRYDLAMVMHQGRWISVDAHLPNHLVAEELDAGRLAPFSAYSTARREVRHGRSRFDFLLEGPNMAPCLIEVKSATLVEDGLACFPDAVTVRGRRHVLELTDALELGYRSAVVFVIQRDDARGFRPHDESDPEFGQALREAARRGVEIYAYGCCVEPGSVWIDRPVPTYLGRIPSRAEGA